MVSTLNGIHLKMPVEEVNRFKGTRYTIFKGRKVRKRITHMQT
jgi:hypothetical protein